MQQKIPKSSIGGAMQQSSQMNSFFSEHPAT